MQLADFTTQFRGNLIINAYQTWLKPRSKVLDVGCGNGVIADILAREFKLNLVGCDVAKYLARPIKFAAMSNNTKLPFKGRPFATAMFNDVLHHVEFVNQDQVLKEALRVSHQVLIFELQPTPLTRLFDWSLNIIHYRQMAIPFTYHSPREWELIFKWLNINWYKSAVPSPWFYPFTHVAYRLTPKKT